MSKVIHVHLIFEKKNIYFGSISAIFETLTEKQVGITKSSLLHAGLVDDIAKYTKRAMIIQSRLITCTRKGWNSLRTQLKAAKAAFFALISVKLWWKAVFIRLNALNVLKSGKVIHLLIHLVIHLSYYKNEMFWLLIHLVIHFCAYFVLIKRGNIFFLFGIHRFL